MSNKTGVAVLAALKDGNRDLAWQIIREHRDKDEFALWFADTAHTGLERAYDDETHTRLLQSNGLRFAGGQPPDEHGQTAPIDLPPSHHQPTNTDLACQWLTVWYDRKHNPNTDTTLLDTWLQEHDNPDDTRRTIKGLSYIIENLLAGLRIDPHQLIRDALLIGRAQPPDT
jgi:hypothetical protein